MISGQEVVREIENQKTDAASKPFAEVRILSCGELIPKSKGKKNYIFLVTPVHTKQRHLRVPVVVQWLTNPTRNHEVAGSIPGLMLSGLRIWHCCEPWYRSQMWLGSRVAVALV